MDSEWSWRDWCLKPLFSQADGSSFNGGCLFVDERCDFQNDRYSHMLTNQSAWPGRSKSENWVGCQVACAPAVMFFALLAGGFPFWFLKRHGKV